LLGNIKGKRLLGKPIRTGEEKIVVGIEGI
jgi:hypothetical protein